MTLDGFIRAEMVRFAVEEGQRHGGVNNMLAVCHVLRNRVFAGWGDWLEVVTTAGRKRANAPDDRQADFRAMDVRTVLNRVDEIYTRVDTSDLVGGALWYVDQNAPVMDWFEREILGRPDEHARVAHVGPVWFFK